MVQKGSLSNQTLYSHKSKKYNIDIMLTHAKVKNLLTKKDSNECANTIEHTVLDNLKNFKTLNYSKP